MLRTHKHKLEPRLKAKGWDKRGLRLLDRLEERTYSLLLPATMLFIILGGFFLLTGILMLTVVFPFKVTGVFIILSGLLFGYIFERHIEEFDIGLHHYFFSGAAILVSAFISILCAVAILGHFMKIAVQANISLLVLLYVLPFSLPHLFSRKKYKSTE
ncbi:MAG: hypothetical protein HGA85_05490 [Nanoarchaeota archaeon]|nr:hypothetical protein [Nanoarchaeota archaeon]